MEATCGLNRPLNAHCRNRFGSARGILGQSRVSWHTFHSNLDVQPAQACSKGESSATPHQAKVVLHRFTNALRGVPSHLNHAGETGKAPDSFFVPKLKAGGETPLMKVPL
jgi:hypothetical protein